MAQCRAKRWDAQKHCQRIHCDYCGHVLKGTGNNIGNANALRSQIMTSSKLSRPRPRPRHGALGVVRAAVDGKRPVGKGSALLALKRVAAGFGCGPTMRPQVPCSSHGCIGKGRHLTDLLVATLVSAKLESARSSCRYLVASMRMTHAAYRKKFVKHVAMELFNNLGHWAIVSQKRRDEKSIAYTVCLNGRFRPVAPWGLSGVTSGV